jgi:DNA segregation ATPase FtsK/SpoIIIE, S-DNA-T family
MSNIKYMRPPISLLSYIETFNSSKEVSAEEIFVTDLRKILESDAFNNFNGKFPVPIGVNSKLEPLIINLENANNLFMAGTLGHGTDLIIHSMICSILLTYLPADVRLLLFDKKQELAIYERIPHLIAPIATQTNQIVICLKWALNEMKRRAKIKEKIIKGSFELQLTKNEYSNPHIIIVISEISDLIVDRRDEIETILIDLVNNSHELGIHMIMTTQRQPTRFLNEKLKDKFTDRISFKSLSTSASNLVIDSPDAVNLRIAEGHYLNCENSSYERFFTPLVDHEDIEKITSHIRKESKDNYNIQLTKLMSMVKNAPPKIPEDLYEKACSFVLNTRKVSNSMIQRHFKIGYNLAARIVEKMEENGIISTTDSTGKHKVLKS